MDRENLFEEEEFKVVEIINDNLEDEEETSEEDNVITSESENTEPEQTEEDKEEIAPYAETIRAPEGENPLVEDDFHDKEETSEEPTEGEEEGFVEENPETVLKRIKGKIEAILFLTNRPLQIEDIANHLGEHRDDVEMALVELISEYSFRDEGALEINDVDGYILQVKNAYKDVVNHMVPADISSGALRTLSAIAIKAPVLQSELVEVRGSSAYDHIHELLAMNLITKKRAGRSYKLNVTNKFHEYFELSGDKRELEEMLRQAARDEAIRQSIEDVVENIQEEQQELQEEAS